MKKFYVLILALAVCFSASALTFTDDVYGITYETTGSNTVKVVGYSSQGIRNYLFLGGTVENNGVTYTVIAIADNALENATMEYVRFKNGTIRSIGSQAFKGCSNLNSVEWADEYETGPGVRIASAAFANCTALKATSLPYVTSLGAYAYQGSGLTNIMIKDCDTMNAVAFNGSPLERIVWNNSKQMVVTNLAPGATGQSPFYEIRAQIREVSLMQNAPARLFYQCPYIATVDVGYYVETIGSEAFYRCTALSQLDIFSAHSLTSIGNWAFGYTSINGEMSIGYGNPNLATIGEGAFYGIRITKLIFSGATGFSPAVQANAFGSCPILDEIRIHCPFTSLHADAFNGCTNVGTLQVTDASVMATDYASAEASPFNDLSHLFTVHLGVGINRIGAHVFDGCSNLRNIDLLFVQEIGNYAFRNTILYYVNIPSIRKIGNYAFDGTQIQYVRIPQCATHLGNRVFGTTLLNMDYEARNATFSGTGTNSIFSCRTITLGDSVEAIPAYFNSGATGLTAITFPAGVQSIGEKAFFQNTNLAEIALPENINTLGANAFGSNTNLKRLTISGNVPAPGTSFGGTTLNSIYCTCSNQQSVQSQWSSVCSNIISQGSGDFEAPEIDNSTMSGRGTVSVVKTYPADNCSPLYTLTATPASGYTFIRWSDGNEQNPRRVDVLAETFDFPLYADFAGPYDYTQIHADVQPTGGATIRFSDSKNRTHADGKYAIEYGEDMAIIIPDIEDGYTFNRWDYDMLYEASVMEDEDTHILTVSLMQMDDMEGGGKVNQFPQNFTLMLNEKIKVTTLVNDENMGRAGSYENEDGTFTIWAAANEGFEFKGWDVDNDGQIDSTKSMCIVAPTASATYTAFFGEHVRTFFVYVIQRGSGEVDVTRQESDEMWAIPEGETVTLQAELGENTVLRGWYDANNDELLSIENPFIIESIDRDYTLFIETEWVDPTTNGWMVSVLVEPAGYGTIWANIAMESDDVIYQGFAPGDFDLVLTAEARYGYRFVSWEYMMKAGEGSEMELVESYDNPLTIAIPARTSEEMPFIEVFVRFEEIIEGLESVESEKTGGEGLKLIRDGRLYILYNGVLYDALGREL